MKRYTYQGRLRFPYGFHTGDGRRLGAVDQPLFREAGGQVALSGSSLAGVLRADLERLAQEQGSPCVRQPECRCVVCRLFGPRAETGRRRDREESGLRASKLHLLGGAADPGAPTRVRDRVGIDRRTRTAADRRKYDVELAEAGLELPFELRIDDPEAGELAWLEAGLRRLAGRWLFFGGKTASGLGLAELVRLDRAEVDLSDPARLIEHLLGGGALAGATVTPLVPHAGGGAWSEAWEPLPAAPEGGGALPEDVDSAPGSARGQVRIGVRLHFPWGFLVNDPAEALGSGFDHSYARGADGRPVLPGSALRGALRSRAERILRTLGGEAAACDLNRKEASCHEKVEKELRGGRKLSFSDELARHCRACRAFGSARLASSVKITDFLPAGPVEGEPWRHEFIALDRFTGGGLPGAKFNAEASPPVTLAGEIYLEIGPDRLDEWGLGLLALVLRDLLLADIPAGFGTAKGLNEYTARITSVDRFWLRPPAPFSDLAGFEAPGSAGWTAPGAGIEDPGEAGEQAGPALAGRLASWVEALHRELSGPAESAAAGEGTADERI